MIFTSAAYLRGNKALMKQDFLLRVSFRFVGNMIISNGKATTSLLNETEHVHGTSFDRLPSTIAPNSPNYVWYDLLARPTALVSMRYCVDREPPIAYRVNTLAFLPRLWYLPPVHLGHSDFHGLESKKKY